MFRTITAAFVALLPVAAAAQDPIEVDVAYDGFSMTTAPMQYAVAKGIFEKHGLDVNLTFVEGGSVLTQALLGGSVDIAQNGYTPSIAAAVQGAELKIVGGIANKLPFQLVVQGDIASADDLKGKAIGISRLGSSTDTAARFALEALGLTGADVTVLQLGGEGTRAAAFASGQVQGILVQYPRTQEMVEEGAKLLVDVTDIVADYPNTAYVTTTDFAAENEDTVKRFLAAMHEALEGFQADPAEAMKVTASFLQLKEGPAVEAAFRFYADRVYADDLRPSLPGIQAVLDELAKTVPAAAEVKPEQVVDLTALDALVADGTIK